MEQQQYTQAALWRELRRWSCVFAVLALFLCGGVFYGVSSIKVIAPPVAEEPGEVEFTLAWIGKGTVSLKFSGHFRGRGKDLPQCHVVLSDGKTAYVLPTKLYHLEVHHDNVAFDDAYSTVLRFEAHAIRFFLPKGTFAVFLRYTDTHTKTFFATEKSVTL